MIRPVAPIPGRSRRPADVPAEAQRLEVGPLFLANFVHQVVNPLNGVIGTLDNINDGTYPQPIISQKINASRAQLEQCVTLIRNLAYLSDFFFETSGKDSLRQAREGGSSVLPQVVIEAAQFFQIAAEKKGMKIELLDSVTQYRIAVRPELLKQVFINIFDNWLKYGAPNNNVEIKPEINKHNDLTVEISGITIPFDNADAEKIFELGYRAKSAEDRVAQGSGIGLFICRQIMEKVVDGSITAVHQRPHHRSVFKLTFPKAKWQL